MKKILISSVIVIWWFCAALPVFASEVNYDSNNVTSFYGQYEYQNEEPKKPDQEENLTPSKPAPNYASALPTYKGQDVIIPLTGDTSSHVTSGIGVGLLVLIFFKLKGGGNTEKFSNH